MACCPVLCNQYYSVDQKKKQNTLSGARTQGKPQYQKKQISKSNQQKLFGAYLRQIPPNTKHPSGSLLSLYPSSFVVLKGGVH